MLLSLTASLLLQVRGPGLSDSEGPIEVTWSSLQMGILKFKDTGTSKTV
jgi:hypothetical protein